VTGGSKIRKGDKCRRKRIYNASFEKNEWYTLIPLPNGMKWKKLIGG